MKSEIQIIQISENLHTLIRDAEIDYIYDFKTDCHVFRVTIKDKINFLELSKEYLNDNVVKQIITDIKKINLKHELEKMKPQQSIVLTNSGIKLRER